ncbi:serine/threonine-protein kinase [Nocardioides sp.]|uniref:serine/threonine-protein kinase n=1 Tax=Nocardioides sp. TaxID=35761 RepID=UPI002EDA7BA2
MLEQTPGQVVSVVQVVQVVQAVGVGEVFARRYELLDPIADGGMGSVWLVRDLTEGDVKVAKLLRQSDAGSLLRFMREQSTRIHHPHVVTPLSWVGEDDSVLFTMPLVRGGSVAALIGDWGALPEQWTVEIVAQALTALDAVHGARVVHRDVKPANLLLEPTGPGRPHVRLSDFGIAAPLDQPRMTVAATALGTPGYVAPEQRAGGDPDPRQDLYSVGIVGLEMLLGHPPPFTLDELPTTPLARFLARASDPDPERRPDSAATMLAELRAEWPERPWPDGEIEVLDQFAPHGNTPRSAEPRLEPPTTVLPREAPATPPHPRRQPSMAPIVALGIAGVLLVLAAVVLLVVG